MEYEHCDFDKAYPHHIKITMSDNEAISGANDVWQSITQTCIRHTDYARDLDGYKNAVAQICGCVVISSRYNDFFENLQDHVDAVVRNSDIMERTIYLQDNKVSTVTLGYSIAFRRKEDAMLFKLTYGGN